jgi:hypothetical protein
MSWNDTLAIQSVIQAAATAANSVNAGRVYVSMAPAPPAGGALPLPYWIIHPTDGIDEQMRYTGPSSTEHPEFTIHTVGSTANQTKVNADLVKGSLVVAGFGIIPTVTGRRNQRLSYRSPIPVQMDHTVTPPLCFHVAQISWISDPA